MRSRFAILIIALVICVGAAETFGQAAYKIKQTVSMSGQNMTNTTYVRGQRKRTETGGMMGMGGDVANIEQCDLKQYVKVNDKKKMYTVDPFDTVETAPKPNRPTAAKTAPVTKGGTVTVASNITDTGERKQMFGVTARHLKTSTVMSSSPDACNPVNMKSETDGWYIDLPEFSCPINIRDTTPQYSAPQTGGCTDRYVTKNTGGGKLGFPLTESRTMSMDGGMSFSQTTETVEFSKAPLDIALFDIPQGYTLASNSQDLYSRPDYANIARAAQYNETTPVADYPKAAAASFSGKKIGVLMPNNRGDALSIQELQSFLISRLTNSNVMGVAVSSEAEARSMNLDYILTSDITKLKQSAAGKIGGLFGKVTGTPTAGTYDAQVEYRLVKLADGKEVLKSKSAAKSDTEITAAAQNILGMEATAVLGSIR